MRTKGDILEGERTRHPIIFLKEENSDQFIGCIITHSGRYENNIGLKMTHFKQTDGLGNEYKIQFENSYFINLKIIKINDWGPFIKVRELTREGVSFIENYLNDNRPTLW